MEKLGIALSVINAIGSIATAITLIIGLRKLGTRLKVTGEHFIKKSDTFFLSIYNNTLYDNEIEKVCLFKGNPLCLFKESFPIYILNLEGFGLEINPNTKNAIINKGSKVEIPIPCKCVSCNYKRMGEAFGKVYEKIYILVKDRRGKYYCINTKMNADAFRIFGQE